MQKPLEKDGMRKQSIGKRTLLVEFKAPKELVEAFDSEMRLHFSSRSEAIRSLMRAFLEGKKKK